MTRNGNHTRSNVAVGAGDSGHGFGIGHVDDFGESEISDMGFEIVVEQNVGGLDIAVDDPGLAVVVEVRESLGGPKSDLEPVGPAQHRARRPVQRVPQAPVHHVLVEQEIRALVVAEPVELHDVPVPDLPERRDLRSEAVLDPVVVPFAVRRELLHRDRLSRPGLGPVHGPTRASSHCEALVEVVRCLDEVLV